MILVGEDVVREIRAKARRHLKRQRAHCNASHWIKVQQLRQLERELPDLVQWYAKGFIEPALRLYVRQEILPIVLAELEHDGVVRHFTNAEANATMSDTPVSFAAFLASLAWAQQQAFNELPSLDTYGPDAWHLTFTRIIPGMDRAVFDDLWPLFTAWQESRAS